MKQEIINELSERYTVVDGLPPEGGREITFIKEGVSKVNNLWTWYLAPVCHVLDMSSLDTVYVNEQEDRITITAVRNN